jgi:hypothetical protein
MRKLLAIFASLAALTVVGGRAEAAAAPAATRYTVLDETGSQLRADFNRAKGTVRLLFVVDPTCPGCLRGLDDMNKALLANTHDTRLQTFVVHVPVLTPAPQAKDVPPAAMLLHNADVHHYWNPSGAFGRALSDGVGLKSDGKPVYAWDVWLLYGSEATWDGTNPPKPRLLMHQLWALQGSKEFPRFDSKAFTQQVHQLLTQLPATTAAR